MPTRSLPDLPPTIWMVQLLVKDEDVTKLLRVIVDTGVGMHKIEPVAQMPAEITVSDDTVMSMLLLKDRAEQEGVAQAQSTKKKKAKAKRPSNKKFDQNAYEFAYGVLKRKPMNVGDMKKEFVRVGRKPDSAYPTLHVLKNEMRRIAVDAKGIYRVTGVSMKALKFKRKPKPKPAPAPEPAAVVVHGDTATGKTEVVAA